MLFGGWWQWLWQLHTQYCLWMAYVFLLLNRFDGDYSQCCLIDEDDNVLVMAL